MTHLGCALQDSLVQTLPAQLSRTFEIPPIRSHRSVACQRGGENQAVGQRCRLECDSPSNLQFRSRLPSVPKNHVMGDADTLPVLGEGNFPACDRGDADFTNLNLHFIVTRVDDSDKSHQGIEELVISKSP